MQTAQASLARGRSITYERFYGADTQKLVSLSEAESQQRKTRIYEVLADTSAEAESRSLSYAGIQRSPSQAGVQSNAKEQEARAREGERSGRGEGIHFLRSVVARLGHHGQQTLLQLAPTYRGHVSRARFDFTKYAEIKETFINLATMTEVLLQ